MNRKSLQVAHAGNKNSIVSDFLHDAYVPLLYNLCKFQCVEFTLLEYSIKIHTRPRQTCLCIASRLLELISGTCSSLL